MRKSISILLVVSIVILSLSTTSWAQGKSMLIHIKTDLGKDDAQICVAYNMVWAGLEAGYETTVLIDASAVNTYKKGWRGTDKLEGYKMPETLRKELSSQLGVSLNNIPATYGKYLEFLHKKGAKFYINGAMLVVSGISKTYGDMSNISTGIFTPTTIPEMINLISSSDEYIVY